jgi:hypothetical protein
MAMSDPYRRVPGPGEPLEHTVRAGFAAVIARLDRLADRVARLEEELEALRQPSSRVAARAAAPHPAPADAPAPASQAPPPAEDPASRIDESLIWGADGQRPRPGSAIGADRFAAEMGGERPEEGSGLSKLLKRKRDEGPPGG